MNQVQLLLIFTAIFCAFTVLFILTMMFFGRLIRLQLKIWFMANKGYMQIEHVGEDRVRRYFYLRPSQEKYDVKQGVYILQQETITKVSELLRKIPRKLEKGSPEEESQEITRLISIISNLKYDKNAETLRWGIPTITYYGDDPNPIYYPDRKKIYSASIINNVILKILTMRNFKLFQKWFMIIAIAGGCMAVGIIILAVLYSKQIQNLGFCQAMLNATANKLHDYLPPLLNGTANATGVVPVRL